MVDFALYLLKADSRTYWQTVGTPPSGRLITSMIFCLPKVRKQDFLQQNMKLRKSGVSAEVRND